MNPSQLKEDLTAIQALLESRGWQILLEAIEADVLAAAYGLSDKAEMSPAEVHFSRGAIRAARNFAVLPKLLSGKLENDLLIATAMKPDGAIK